MDQQNGGSAPAGTAPSRTTTILYCGSCGRRWSDEHGFCPGCGSARPPHVPTPTPPPAAGDFDLAPPAPATAGSPDEDVDQAAAEPGTDPAPTRPRRKRRLLVAGVAAVAVAIAAAVPLVLGDGGDGDSYDVNASLARAHEALDGPAGELSRASKLAEVRQAGVSARGAVADVTGELDQIDRVSDPDAQRVARQTLEAEQVLLEQWGRLADLSEQTSGEWAALSSTISEAADEWDDTQGRLGTAEVEAAPTALRRKVDQATGDTGTWLKETAGTLETWRGETARIAADKQAQAAELDVYAAAVRGQITRYSGLRKDLAAFTVRLDRGDVSTWSEAYGTLSDAASDRLAVRNALASLTPPSALYGSHSGLLSTIDTAVSAVQSASEGLRQYQYSYYTRLKDTPAWQTFQQQSDVISSSYGAAVSAWEQQVTDETARINAIVVPPAPAV